MLGKLKQFKDAKNKLKEMQNNLSQESIEGTAAWGKIKITMDGTQKITGIDIDPELLSPDKKAKVEDGIKDAFADCLKKIQKVMMSRMKDSDINLSDFMK